MDVGCDFLISKFIPRMKLKLLGISGYGVGVKPGWSAGWVIEGLLATKYHELIVLKRSLRSKSGPMLTPCTCPSTAYEYTG